MAGFYSDFTTVRLTEPEPLMLLANLRALDATAGIQHDLGTRAYRLKKGTAWTGPQIAAAQTVLETSPALTPQTAAQSFIDNMPIVEKAIVLTIIDEINVIRDWFVAFQATTALAVSLADLKARVAALPSMPDRTVPQAIAAVRAKAGTL